MRCWVWAEVASNRWVPVDAGGDNVRQGTEPHLYSGLELYLCMFGAGT